MQVGLAHGAAKEGTNLVKESGDRVTSIEKSHVHLDEIKRLIEVAIEQTSNENRQPLTAKS